MLDKGTYLYKSENPFPIKAKRLNVSAVQIITYLNVLNRWQLAKLHKLVKVVCTKFTQNKYNIYKLSFKNAIYR